MTFTVKHRLLPGSPFIADYMCVTCGVTEMLVARDANGDPPATMSCGCGEPAELVFGCPKIMNPAFIPTAINEPGASRHDKPDPRALDTRDLAEGKVTKAEWKKKQAEITKARRHAKRIASGRASKRIQVNSAGIK